MRAEHRPPARVFLVWLAAAAALSGCDSGAPPAAGGAPPPEVGVTLIEARPLTLSTELPGRATPYRIAEVRPRVSGIVQAREFDEGALIEAGQLLYRIDPAPYRAIHANAEAALARAQATRDRARLKAERYANLAKAKAVSEEDGDDAEAALKEAIASVAVAQADLASARINLDYTRVTSPIAGHIGRSTVTQGALVTADQELALATVQQLDPIYIDLVQSSGEQLRLRRALDAGRLRRPAGDAPRVTLTLEDGSAYPLAGRLEFSEVSVDPRTGTVTLRARFPNPDHLLLPGMFVRAQVEEGMRADAILAPQQGVGHDRRGQPTALVLNAEDAVEQRALRVERAIGHDWLVDSGLMSGDRLIVEGSQKVRPGDKARAVVVPSGNAEPARAAPPPPTADH